MRGGALPPALLCAAFGLALAFAPRRAFGASLLALAAAAVAASFAPIPRAWTDAMFLGCWISVVIAGASVHLPGGIGPRAALLLAVNSGVWSGAVIAVAGARIDLLKALPWALLCLPGAWLVATRRQIALKVAASWLIAAAVLVAVLPIVTPTPGYESDHLE